ncbi:hypothetical protein QR680_013963 [Steinernema hermaphroditum]|uniref:WAP domain-containing protein n=1 Tax=Steinernema hermaphroditum TaxID=289476 RepID=A0AA39M2F0_9BILA|nr:hypothetical protein QR680_013963 [Steinernema hermaphroditum]
MGISVVLLLTIGSIRADLLFVPPISQCPDNPDFPLLTPCPCEDNYSCYSTIKGFFCCPDFIYPTLSSSPTIGSTLMHSSEGPTTTVKVTTTKLPPASTTFKMSGSSAKVTQSPSTSTMPTTSISQDRTTTASKKTTKMALSSTRTSQSPTTVHCQLRLAREEQQAPPEFIPLQKSPHQRCQPPQEHLSKYDQTCCDIYHSTENDVFRFHNCLIHENPKNTHIDGTRNSLTLNVRNTRKYCSYKDKHIVTNSLDFHDS